MKFSLDKYIEIPANRRNTLQVFITNNCNLKCNGCFARKIMKNSLNISLEEYKEVLLVAKTKGVKQINILGGEPLLHPQLLEILKLTKYSGFKCTVYTNGYFLNRYNNKDFEGIKLRVSLYCKSGQCKSIMDLPKTDLTFDSCYMVRKTTTVQELLDTANYLEANYKCNTFFISSIRELDNPRKEFFDDTILSMNLLKYKELICEFLKEYNGSMEIHISKRGVFESTRTLAENKCRFANYVIGGQIVQCPYDLVNCKFQKDYSFNNRQCQHNNTCLMSKIVYKRIKEQVDRHTER